MRLNAPAIPLTVAALTAALFVLGTVAGAPARAIDNPVLFVTQVPIPADFTTIGSTFGNHRTAMTSVGRGGDLWIRYADGTLRNLTAAAGYGMDGFQGDDAIAVRDPAVHWDGRKAIFSMVIGAPTEQYQQIETFWQLYEITGLRPEETPVITKVPNQPETFNNLTPIYTSDDKVLFTSDRPRDGALHLYPQLDEYELTPIVSGIWRLDPVTGDLRILNHAPSGDFTPIVDSFGRVVFTQWDHLQRDQLADIDVGPISDCYDGRFFGTFNWSDESPDSIPLEDDRTEFFPEPRPCRNDLLDGTPFVGQLVNHFFPWQMKQDGRESETLNHIGRQELHGYINRARHDDPNVVEYYGQLPRSNPNDLERMFHIREDPTNRGVYIGTQADEFGTHSGGQIVSLEGHPNLHADTMNVAYLTHPDTAHPSESPSPDHSGLYRDPLRTSDGTYVAVHTPETRADANDGTRANPVSRYDYRLKTLALGANGYAEAATPLTDGISETITYWDPDVSVTYDGDLWELQPVELTARDRPPLDPAFFSEDGSALVPLAGLDGPEFRDFLIENDLALIASQNVTVRDDGDVQQPFNLEVPGGVQTTGASGAIYSVPYMQIFQADQIRGRESQSGRRVLAQPLHDPAALGANLPTPIGAPDGSFAVASDGSFAAFVPASRALSWQLVDPTGEPVVRERYWLTFQPGEVRVCGSCHGVNDENQAGGGDPTNLPVAVLELLQFWEAGRADGQAAP